MQMTQLLDNFSATKQLLKKYYLKEKPKPKNPNYLKEKPIESIRGKVDYNNKN